MAVGEFGVAGPGGVRGFKAEIKRARRDAESVRGMGAGFGPAFFCVWR